MPTPAIKSETQEPRKISPIVKSESSESRPQTPPVFKSIRKRNTITEIPSGGTPQETITRHRTRREHWQLRNLKLSMDALLTQLRVGG